MSWFRKPAERDSFAVRMIAIKLGDRFLSLGLRDTKLVAALGAKTGLTGRACAVDADAALATRGAAAVEAHGALIEVQHAAWDALPYEPGSFDVVLVRDVLSTLGVDARRRCVDAIVNVLRGGGRVIVVESAKVGADAVTAPLTAAGFAAVRVLAEAERTIYVEGIKRATA